jgi:hypothetical protein
MVDEPTATGRTSSGRFGQLEPMISRSAWLRQESLFEGDFAIAIGLKRHTSLALQRPADDGVMTTKNRLRK